MAFVISQKESYTWPVKYEYANKGKMDKAEFTAEFKRLPQSRIDEIRKSALADQMTDDEVVEEVLLGWSGIRTAENEEFTDNDANRRILLDLPGMRTAIINAFTDSILGAARKN